MLIPTESQIHCHVSYFLFLRFMKGKVLIMRTVYTILVLLYSTKGKFSVGFFLIAFSLFLLIIFSSGGVVVRLMFNKFCHSSPSL